MKSLLTRIEQAGSDTRRVAIIAENIKPIKSFASKSRRNEIDFNYLNLMLTSLYKKEKFELIYILYQDFNFNNLNEGEMGAEFAYKWIKSLNIKGKQNIIAKNYKSLQKIPALSPEVLEILEKAKQKSQVPMSFHFLRGVEVLMILSLVFIIVAGFRNLGAIVVCSGFIIIVQWTRYFFTFRKKNIQLYSALALAQFISIALTTILFLLSSDLPWAALLLFPMTISVCRWLAESKLVLKEI